MPKRLSGSVVKDVIYFFACHMHAFEWFGGVPEKVTPDNLKAAIIVASFVRRPRMQQSIKAINRETGKHRRVIRRILELAEQEGWLDATRELPSEQQLQEVYHEQRGGADSGHLPLDARRDQIEGWRHLRVNWRQSRVLPRPLLSSRKSPAAQFRSQ